MAFGDKCVKCGKRTRMTFSVVVFPPDDAPGARPEQFFKPSCLDHAEESVEEIRDMVAIMRRGELRVAAPPDTKADAEKGD